VKNGEGDPTTWGKVRKVGGGIPPVFEGERGEGESPGRGREGVGRQGTGIPAEWDK